MRAARAPFGYAAPDVQLYAELTGRREPGLFRRPARPAADDPDGLLARVGLPRVARRGPGRRVLVGDAPAPETGRLAAGRPAAAGLGRADAGAGRRRGGPCRRDPGRGTGGARRRLAVLATNDAAEADRWGRPAAIRLHIGLRELQRTGWRCAWADLPQGRAGRAAHPLRRRRGRCCSPSRPWSPSPGR